MKTPVGMPSASIALFGDDRHAAACRAPADRRRVEDMVIARAVLDERPLVIAGRAECLVAELDRGEAVSGGPRGSSIPSRHGPSPVRPRRRGRRRPES